MPSPTSLRTNIIYGTPGMLTEINAAWAAINALTASAYRIYDVREYGAIGDGVADDTTPIANAATAMMAAGSGILQLQPGTYKVTSLPTFTPKTVAGPLTYSIQGGGSGVTTIMHYGTSQAASLTVNHPLFDPDNVTPGAPQWSGFTIDGTNSSGGCCGIVWGDISYGSFFDVQCKNFATGDGWFFNNPFGWTEGMGFQSCRSEYNLNQMRFDCGSGRVIGTFAGTISSGATFTSISTTPLTAALYIGQRIVIAAATSVLGVTTQTVVVAAVASVGATTITVNSNTADTTYTSGTAKVYWGGYGSFDYFTMDSMYMQANANQNGIVSEISRGIAENMQRIGSRIRITGNFHTAATNTGAMFWLKGTDNWDDTVWQVDCEVGGAEIAHQSVKITSTTATITGSGTFVLFGFTAASFTGGNWQFGPTGQICVAGVTDSGGLTFRQMRRPGFLDIAPGVDPGGYTPASTTGTAWQNTTGYDLFVTIPFTFTGAATVGWNVDTWNGLPAGVNVAAGPSGITIPITFVHYNKAWARLDWTNATKGTATIRYVN